MADNPKSAKKPFKGGRKGGTIYPRLVLKDALDYAQKLIRKTHTGPQAAQTILIGVFGNKGAVGGVRASAMKQYGLMDGDAKAYQASDLAKAIEAATPDQRTELIKRAFLTSRTFNAIFKTLQGDTVSRAKVRQVVLSENVHPDNADECVEFFIEGAKTADLGSPNGDDFVLKAANSAPTVEPKIVEDDEMSTSGATEEIDDGNKPPLPASPGAEDNAALMQPAAKQAGVTVTFAVDSSLDTDKLAKQLDLLRKYGII